MPMNRGIVVLVLSAVTLGCGGVVEDARQASGSSSAGSGAGGSPANTASTSTGAGGSPACADGDACDDGDACTTNDACANGICSGAAIACTTPPAPECVSAATRRTYGLAGTCAAGACAYAHTDTTCPDGCTGGACNSARMHLGSQHSCAVTPTGGVKCWGTWRGYTSTYPTSMVAETVTGLDSGVIALGGGPYHTCAIKSNSAPVCWGMNQSGDIGSGSTEMKDVPIPVEVSGLGADVVAIAGGYVHTCALTSGGGVKCWGRNDRGQLGNGSTKDSLTPVDVTGLGSGVIAIRGGTMHTCALRASGGVQCWGSNVDGQLGNNSTLDSHVPVDVVGLAAGIVGLGGGWYHACALTSKGGVQCWGNNTYGELGDGSATESPVPVDVTGLDPGVIAVSGGVSITVALTSRGSVQRWGIVTEEYGVPPSSQLVPGDLPGLASGALAIAAGGGHSCALTAGGAIACWGDNTAGQLGNDSTTTSPTPVNVVGF